MRRYLGDPACCLGSQRIAKEVLACKDAGGLDTEVFEAQSLHGSTATQLLKEGVQADVFRVKGCCSRIKMLDTY